MQIDFKGWKIGLGDIIPGGSGEHKGREKVLIKETYKSVIIKSLWLYKKNVCAGRRCSLRF